MFPCRALLCRYGNLEDVRHPAEALLSRAQNPKSSLHPACRYSDLEDMQRSVLAFEAIYEQEGLSVEEGVVEREFKTATEDFQRQEQDYDEERLMEQVRETLKVRPPSPKPSFHCP